MSWDDVLCVLALLSFVVLGFGMGTAVGACSRMPSGVTFDCVASGARP